MLCIPWSIPKDWYYCSCYSLAEETRPVWIVRYLQSNIKAQSLFYKQIFWGVIYIRYNSHMSIQVDDFDKCVHPCNCHTSQGRTFPLSQKVPCAVCSLLPLLQPLVWLVSSVLEFPCMYHHVLFSVCLLSSNVCESHSCFCFHQYFAPFNCQEFPTYECISIFNLTSVDDIQTVSSF